MLFNADPRPSYTYRFTPEQAEESLLNFTWDGPGLYRFPDTSILVISESREYDNQFHQKTEPNEVFLFCVYEGRDFADILNSMHQLPVRKHVKIGK